MESDLVSHKDYYRLSIDIFKVISLERHIRKVDGKTFLDQKFSEYEKLIKSSNVFDSEYVFDTIATRVPIIPSITKFVTNADRREEHAFLDIARNFGNSLMNLPGYLLSRTRQKKRERYIKNHRDATEEYFYKDVHILALSELKKEEEAIKEIEGSKKAKSENDKHIVVSSQELTIIPAHNPTTINNDSLEENVIIDIKDEPTSHDSTLHR